MANKGIDIEIRSRENERKNVVKRTKESYEE